MNPGEFPQKTYSPFWSVWLVFMVFLLVQCAHLAEDFRARSQMKAMRTQFKPALIQAQTVNQTTEAVGRDLVALAPNSSEAAKIISEFKIRVGSPAGARPTQK
jgi:hypothetical protein